MNEIVEESRCESGERVERSICKSGDSTFVNVFCLSIIKHMITNIIPSTLSSTPNCVVGKRAMTIIGEEIL